MRKAPRLAVLARGTRITDWGVHIGVFGLAALVYATGFDRLSSGFGTSVHQVLLLQILCYPAAYLLNDYVDCESDRAKAPANHGRPRRPSPWLIAGLFLASGVWAWRMSRPAALVCVVVSTALALAYSLPPMRLKVRGLAGVAAAALGQRLPFFLLLSVLQPSRSVSAVWLGAYLAGLGTLFILHHQLDDLEVDRATGTMTWAVRQGRVPVHRALLATRLGLVALAATAWLLEGADALSRYPPPRFRLAYTVLVAVTLLAFGLRHGTRPRQLALVRAPRRARWAPPGAAGPAAVRIVGAGAAGLMAGIKLAERGVRVDVHEAGSGLGGMHVQAEGIHFTHVDPARLSAVLGFPVMGAFSRVDLERGYYRGCRHMPRWRPAWVCRRGSSPGTLDHLLYEALRQRGGRVHFASREAWRTPIPNTRFILATGLAPSTLRALGLPGRRIVGFQAASAGRPGTATIYYRHPGLGRDYAYAAEMAGIRYALVFARDELPESAARLAAEMMRRTEGLDVGAWVNLAPGAVPLRPCLFHGEYILAGALAGMIDPFYLSGLSGALVSGWLAALAVEQPERAQDEFRWFCRNWTRSERLWQAAQWRAAPPLPFFTAASVHACLTPVGVP